MPIDGAFGDLRQSSIGLLFFSEGLFEKPYCVAQSELVGPGLECAIARDLVMLDCPCRSEKPASSAGEPL